MAKEPFHGETRAEKRRYERKPIQLKVSYFCLERGNVSHAKSDLAEDLGAGGLLMRSRHPLEKNQILMLTLFLPPAESRQEKKINEVPAGEDPINVEILCRVAWSKPADAGEHLIGVQFLDLDQSNRKWLKDFLVDFQLDQPDSALYS